MIAEATTVLQVDLEARFPAVGRMDILEMYHARPWQSDSSLVSAWSFKEKQNKAIPQLRCRFHNKIAQMMLVAHCHLIKATQLNAGTVFPI